MAKVLGFKDKKECFLQKKNKKKRILGDFTFISASIFIFFAINVLTQTFT
jgi:hypothetical protein